MINNTVSSYIASLIYPIERPDISLSCYSGTSTCSCPCVVSTFQLPSGLCAVPSRRLKFKPCILGAFEFRNQTQISLFGVGQFIFYLIGRLLQKKNTTFCTAFKHLFLNFFVDRFKISFQRRVFPYTPVIVDLKTQFRSRII